jgi:hypothetical protein
MWWDNRKGLPDFTGLKLSVDRKCQERKWGIQKVGLNKNDDRLELVNIGTVGWSGNSGFHCLNLAVQFGARKIVLVGYDMRVDKGIHWHGPHKGGLNNPTERNVMRWRRCVDAAAEMIAAMGIKVINASPISALTKYPKMSLLEAMEC